MHETESHDLSDDSDYAASQDQGSIHESHGNDGLKDLTGSEIVYLKDNVSIHPTQYASERISGRLRLLKQATLLFMTWVPYKQYSNDLHAMKHTSSSSLLEKDKNLYTIKALPLTEVRYIRRHTPAFGWQYIIVVLKSGLAYPPLYFYNGGVREFLGTLKQHVYLARSSDDANVFLVNNFQDPLQTCMATVSLIIAPCAYTVNALNHMRSLSSLELPTIVTVANGISAPNSLNSLSTIRNSKENVTPRGNNGDLVASEVTERLQQRRRDPARDLSLQVLEKFSLVTKFARETTTQLFRENQFFDGLSGYERSQLSQSSPILTPLEPKYAPQDADTSKVFDGHSMESDSPEIDKLSLVWGKPRLHHLGSEEWSKFLDAEGRITDSKALREQIFYGGVKPQLRKEVWKFLLGYHEYDSTYAEREYLAVAKKSEYETIKNQWQSISPTQAMRFAKYRERKSLIEKDVVRTDRTLPFYDGDDNHNVNLLRDILLTYSFYNFDLGYCQGMSDFLSPILYVMEDESESFWCFVALMERLGPNFNRDQNGMHSQLLALSKLVELLDLPLHNYLKQADCLNYFFCFRWILIQFKREFEYEKIMHLWEVLWTHYLSEHFHLYVSVAILKRYRRKIIDEQMDFDTLLKFINELSCHIHLDSTLRDAEALCVCAGENGAALIPPGTPPSLPVEISLFDQSF